MSFFFTFFLLWKKLPGRKSRSIAVFLYFLFALEEAAWQKVAKRDSFSLLISFCIRRNCLRESRGA